MKRVVLYGTMAAAVFFLGVVLFRTLPTDQPAAARPKPSQNPSLSARTGTSTVGAAPVVKSPAGLGNESMNERPASRETAYEAVLDLSRPLKPQLVSYFSQNMGGPPPNLYLEIRKHLQEAGPVILEILRDNSLKEAARTGAVYALQRVDVPGAKEALFELARSPGEGTLRWSVIETIGKRGDLGSADALIAMIPADGDELVTRKKIIEALGYTGDPQARLGIQKAMERSQIVWESFPEAVQRANLQLDAASAKNPVAATIPYLHSEDPAMREWAMVFLKRLDAPQLALSFRQAADSIKQWPPGKRKMNARLEYELLTAVKEGGGTLEPREVEFIHAYSSQRPYQMP